MLPTTYKETPQEAARRQANFIILRTLENSIPPTIFEQLVKQALELPKRIDWTGAEKDLTFSELKVNFSQVDQNFLPQLLEQGANRSNSQISKLNPNDQIQIANPKSSQLQVGKCTNLLLALKTMHLPSFIADQKKSLINHQISRFERMKTVFGHALIQEGFNAPIYNVKYDHTGNFIISGADDGIIKIWDRDTLNLQAALHSHEDVITDMDISKCNKYLATASKDGKIIIWDWKKCKKVEELAAHNGTVNNIRFFSFSNKNSKDPRKAFEEIQILVTCSEDGTIKVYDVASLAPAGNSQDGQGARRTSRNRNENQGLQRRERYHICLTPEDFRPGAKNKKIDSIHLNQNGLLAAGSDKGEVYLWELDLMAFKRQNPKAYVWLGSSKKHIKTVHFCEFSPTGKMLFTGSVDGTAKIWNIEKGRTKKNDQQQKMPLALTDDRLIATLEEKRREWQCDSLTWSVHGRYAISALSGKVEGDRNKDYSVIKVYDVQTGYIIQDLAKGNNIQLMNYSFVLAAHPKIEEVFMSGSDGGTICLWNIKTRSLIKKFLEYGVYSFEKYTMNDPYDGRFSPDGSSFVVGSVMGTISLFSCESAIFKYQATRVEQFYPRDEIKHPANIYYDNDANEEPQVCSYSLIPYEVQPPSSLFGKYSNSRKLTNEEYERNLNLRRELCQEEENFIQGQLEEGLRNDLFNPDNEPGIDFGNNEAEINNEEQQELRRGNARGRIYSQQMSQNGSQDQQDRSNDAQNQRRGQRGRRPILQPSRTAQQIERVIMNPNFDPDNDFYDRESDENFELQQEDSDNSEDEDFESEGNEEDEDYGTHTNSRRVLQRPNRNFRQVANNVLREEENKRTENSRALRAQRRQLRLQSANQEEEKGITTRACKRRAVIEDDDGSNLVNNNSDGDDYAMSDVETKKAAGGRRRLVKNNGRTNKDELPSSDDVSIKSNMLDDDDDEAEYGRKTRRAAKMSSNIRQSEKSQQERAKNRNLRSRRNRKTYAGMDESESSFQESNNNSEDEEEKIAPSKSNNDQGRSQGGRKRKAVIDNDSDEEMIDADVTMPDDKLKKLKGDEDYELLIAGDNNQIQLEEDMMMQVQEQNRKCSFCLRVDKPLLGPFVKQGKNRQIIGEPLYFHKDCIEVNNHSFFCKQKNKWLNIGKALEVFSKKPCMCARCGQIGATIKCSDCYKFFHGHLCSQLYMIWIGGQSYQCFECRNKANFYMFRDKEPQIDKQEIKQMRKAMVRDHLLAEKQASKTYNPQIGDEVYYFFQGHEKFISYYNCFFYCGDEENLPFEYPWKAHPDYLEKTTLCKIKSMSYRFPSKNALYLIKRYGKTQQIQQIPQIITKIELEIVENTDDQELTFEIELFPNELPEFLVLRKVYDLAVFQYERLQTENKLIGQIFKTKNRNYNKVKIVDILQKEPTFYPDTNWETIFFRPEEAYRLRERGRRGLRRDQEEEEPPEIMNFWELQLNANEEQEEEKSPQSIALDAAERGTIVNIINDYIEKKNDIVIPFLNRVTDQIASDYRQHISAEMFLNLIIQRLLNNYYRTHEQLYFDLDLIYINAKTYNGDDSELTTQARKIVEKLKREIKSSLDDSQKSKRVEETKISIPLTKPIGKLTAPSRLDPGMSSMDIFKKDQQQQQQQQIPQQLNNGIQGQRKKESLEETKIIPKTQQQQQNTSSNKSSKSQPKPQDLNDAIMDGIHVQIDESDTSECKITPKTPAQDLTNGGRRSTRQQYKAQNESYLDSTTHFSTEEKNIDYQSNNNRNEGSNADQVVQGSLLGKRVTRSGRQTRVVKQSLNENDSDDDFEIKLMDQTTNGALNGTRKRLRH